MCEIPKGGRRLTHLGRWNQGGGRWKMKRVKPDSGVPNTQRGVYMKDEAKSVKGFNQGANVIGSEF